MQFLNQQINPLGMGCWPIGGPMFSGGHSMGYANSDDAESIKTIHAAIDAGITVFDTAAAYGAGHSERLLGQALSDRPEALIITKIGIGIDEATKELSFDMPRAPEVAPAIEACLKRLQRDRIDLLLLHQNEMPIDDAAPIFEEMDKAVKAGKLRAFGWSTDFSDRASAFASYESFQAVEHAMNLLWDAPKLQATLRKHELTALIRSPLAMGALSGKYGPNDSVSANDIRAARQDWMEYFKDGRINPDVLNKLNAVRDLLQTGGRTLVQGALAWLWAKGENNLPVPGARTVDQITGIAGALDHGPLPQSVIADIETLIPRGSANDPERAR